MSKLDDIVLKPAYWQLDKYEIAKIDLKILMLELYGSALKEADSFEDVGDLFRKKVKQL